MTSPIPGKAYEVFPAAILIMSQCLRTVRWTVLSGKRAAARVAFPGWGSGAPGKQSVGLFSAKGGRHPCCLPRVGEGGGGAAG